MRIGRVLRAANARRRDDEGFTLIEMIVSIVVLTVLIGAITLALITVLTLSGTATKSISDTAGAQVVSASLTNDVQSASQITTSPSLPNTQCGTGTQLLGVEWSLVPGSTPPTYRNVVSYLAVQHGRVWALVRSQCTSGFSTTPTSSRAVAASICQPAGATTVVKGCTTPQAPPTITPPTKTAAISAGWTSSVGVTGVSFAITAPQSHYTYTLRAEPAGAVGPGTGGTLGTPTTGCSYATPGTGTYAPSLCFVNFVHYTYTAATANRNRCQTITEGITGTPFQLSFCLKVRAGTESNGAAPPSGWGTQHTPGSVCSTHPKNNFGVLPPPHPPTTPCTNASADAVAVPFPTYTGAPTSEAFLGNNGFYTGVGGDPGLYEYLGGTAATLYFTTIMVVGPGGVPATNWQLVTGDAESTDTGESITWSTCPAASGGGLQTSCSTGSPTFRLIPNNPSSTPIDYYGNACMNKTYTNASPNGWLRYGALGAGKGTYFGPISHAQEVQCASGVSSDKTGTVMLEAPKPSSLTVNMYGAGLEAVFLGFML